MAVYRNYVRKVRQTVQRINAQYGAHGWQPIRLELGESVRKAMAAMRNFDALVVNSVLARPTLSCRSYARTVSRCSPALPLNVDAGICTS